MPRFALDRQTAPVQFRQPLGDDQSQTQTLLLARLAVELHVGAHLLQVLRPQPAAVIGDGQHQDVVRRKQRNLDARARLGKLEGVVDQFVHDLRQIFLRDRHRLVREIHGQVLARLAASRLLRRAHLDNFARHLGLLFPQRVRPLRVRPHQFDLRINQKILHQPFQPPARFMDGLAHLRDFRRLAAWRRPS